MDYAHRPRAAERFRPLPSSLRFTPGNVRKHGTGPRADHVVEHVPLGSSHRRGWDDSLYAPHRLYAASPQPVSRVCPGFEPGQAAVLRGRRRRRILSRRARFRNRTLRPDRFLWQCRLCRQPGGLQQHRHDLDAHHRRRARQHLLRIRRHRIEPGEPGKRAGAHRRRRIGIVDRRFRRGARRRFRRRGGFELCARREQRRPDAVLRRVGEPGRSGLHGRLPGVGEQHHVGAHSAYAPEGPRNRRRREGGPRLPYCGSGWRCLLRGSGILVRFS